jgi:two-component system, OmpR family, sensor histidine kinase RstB
VPRLYQKIYLAIIASLLLVVAIAGAAWRFGSVGSPMGQAVEMAGELAAAVLPPADAPRQAQQQAVDQFAARLKTDLALFDEQKNLIAAAGKPLPPPPVAREGGGWIYGPGGPAWSLRLPDRRWVVTRAQLGHRHPAVGLVLFLGLIALAVGICAYPVVRGLTRRLERLQQGVETLGAGNFSARVKVEGRDEVARLAESFNGAAARIEQLIGSHRLLLANASHELRTPLSRIRLGLELFLQKGEEKYRQELARDIAELDQLLDEILLANRLDAVAALDKTEDIDLLALAAEECAHYDGCSLQGATATVRGDPRLLRRLIRNLIENAQRHGKPPVRLELRRENAAAILDVIDDGEGIPAAERERVFTPFHRLASEGTGLGLSLVRQIARLHGGDAVVASRAGAANCLRVRLPAGSAA